MGYTRMGNCGLNFTSSGTPETNANAVAYSTAHSGRVNGGAHDHQRRLRRLGGGGSEGDLASARQRGG